MSRKYVTLSGDWVANIPQERQLSPTGILSDDLFLISQPALSNVDPDRTYECNGRSYHNQYKSACISYESLSTQIFNESRSDFGIKSMAWELSDHYALADHVHNYSVLSVKPSLSPTADEIKNGEVSSIAVFSVNTRKYPVYMRSVSVYSMPKPYIGQLKFLALTALPNMPNTADFYSSSSFTGWVYPDGRELDITCFQDAYEVFGDIYGTASSGKFKIPNITEFIKPYFPQSYDQSLTGTVAGQNVLLQHQHDIPNMQLAGSVDCTISVASVNDNHWVKAETAAQHGGSNTSKAQSYEFTAAFTCEDLECDDKNIEQASDTSETYPSHMLLPVMIYVGGI